MVGRGSITPGKGGVRASGEMGEAAKGREAAEQADVAALMTGTAAVGPPHPEGRPALRQDAGNVAGICNAIDRPRREP
jgi:hypothetical protein